MSAANTRTDEHSTTGVLLYVVGGLSAASVVAAGYWDGNWHDLQQPESFWSPPHVLLYAGIGVLALATIAGLTLCNRQDWPPVHRAGYRIATLAVLITFVAGAWDESWHRLFGPDPQFSPPHVLLGGGIVLATVGMLIGLGRHRATRGTLRRLVQATFFLTYAAFLLAVNIGIWLVVYLPVPGAYANQLATELLLDGTGVLLFFALLRVVRWPGAATAYALAQFGLEYVGAIATHPVYTGLLWYYPLGILPAVGIDLLRWRGLDILRHFFARLTAGALLATFYYLFFLPASLAYAGTWPQGPWLLALVGAAGVAGAGLAHPFSSRLEAGLRAPLLAIDMPRTLR